MAASRRKFETWDPIAVVAARVAEKKITAQELVQTALDRMTKYESHNAVLSRYDKQALAQAAHIDAQVAKGKKVGRLAGVPFIAKDNFLAQGTFTTAASKILEPFTAPYTATAIQRLEKEGAILVGKANLDAFAHGSSTENSAFGPSKNPYSDEHVPGGSSGGSAVAIRLGMVPFALGTDTGGSIRLPASFCGIVGYKPTYGLVSRYGVVAMASSTDVIGPLTTSVEDAAIVLDVLAARDPLDSTTIERNPNGYIPKTQSLKGKKIGIVKEFFGAGLGKEVAAKVQSAIHALETAGAIAVPVSIPSVELALAVYYIVVPAEVSSNLSRYDGQRYGYHDPAAASLDDSYELAREHGFEAENKRRIMIGTYVLSSGYYDAYYKKAQTVRTKLINEFAQAFSNVDYLIGPTAPSTAFRFGENTKDPLAMYLADIMTVSANLVGCPAISLPAGCSDGGLPIGVQLMAPQRADAELLAVATAAEGSIS